MCRFLTYWGSCTCPFGRSTPDIHWAMSAQSFRASMSLIGDICPKSIVVFRYLVDRPVSHQPSAMPTLELHNKKNNCCREDLPRRAAKVIWCRYNSMNDIINLCMIDGYNMIDVWLIAIRLIYNRSLYNEYMIDCYTIDVQLITIRSIWLLWSIDILSD